MPQHIFLLVLRTFSIHHLQRSCKRQPTADLLKELMIAVLRKSNNSTTFDNGGASSMTVDALRGKLDQKGMDEDGSKIILVSRLEESNSMEELNKRQRIE